MTPEYALEYFPSATNSPYAYNRVLAKSKGLVIKTVVAPAIAPLIKASIIKFNKIR
jgi:hypothetical protein